MRLPRSGRVWFYTPKYAFEPGLGVQDTRTRLPRKPLQVDRKITLQVTYPPTRSHLPATCSRPSRKYNTGLRTSHVPVIVAYRISLLRANGIERPFRTEFCAKSAFSGAVVTRNEIVRTLGQKTLSRAAPPTPTLAELRLILARRHAPVICPVRLSEMTSCGRDALPVQTSAATENV